MKLPASPNSPIVPRLNRCNPRFGRARFILSAGIAALLAAQSAQAATFYWDANGASTTAVAATGTWGTSNFWSTDPTGATATSAQTIDNTSDVVFAAGSNSTGGTVTILTTQAAHSITFDDPVVFTLNGGTAINLGSATAGSGIFVTANAAQNVNTPVILNSAATAIALSNSGTGLLTVNTLTGAATTGTQTVTIGSSSTGGILVGGTIGNGAAGGNVALTINNTSTGVTTLQGNNSYTGGTTITAGTAALTNNSTGFGTGAVAIGASGTANITLSADGNIANVFTGTGTITVAGSTGTPSFTNASGLNGFTGTLNVNTTGAKKVTVGTASEKIGSGATVNITSGGTLYLNTSTASNDGVTFNVVGSGNTENLGAIRIESGSVIGATSSVVLGGDTTLGSNTGTGTINAIISESTTSAVTKVGVGTLVLGGANTYSGATTIGTSGSAANAGTLTISGASGSINTSTGISIIGSGSKLFLDNTAGNVDRVKDTGNVSSSLGGELSLTGNATTNTTETMGAIGVGTGTSIVTVSSAASRVTTLAASGLSRTNSGTGLVRGTSLNQSAATNVSRITLGTAPSGADFVGTNTISGGATNDATQALKIVPWLIGDTSVAGTGSNFVTYDGTLGLRVLNATELESLTTVSTNTAGNNGTSALSGVNTLAAGSKTFNSLVFTNTGNFTAGNAADTLTINSGAMLATNNGGLNGFTSINLGNNEGIFYEVGSGSIFNVNSPIDVTSGGTHSATGAFTKSGQATVVFGATNLYSGVTTINQGVLTIGNGTAGNLAAGSGAITANVGTTLGINMANNDTLANNIVNNGTVSKTSGTTTNILSGNISGAGVLTQNIAAGTLALSGTNTQTGATSITAGTLEFRGAAAMSSTSALTLSNNATLSLRADADTTFTPLSLNAWSGNNTYNFLVNSLNSPAGDGHTLTLNGQVGAFATGNPTINVTSTTGDTLKFGSSAYQISSTVGFDPGNETGFNLTGANVILSGLSNSSANQYGGITVASTTNNTLTINGIAQSNNSRGLHAIVNSGILTLNNTVSLGSGSSHFYVTMNGGTLNLGNAAALNGGGGGSLHLAGGVLDNSSGAALTMTGNPAIGLDGDFAFSTVGSTSAKDLNLGTGAVSLNGAAGARTITTNGAATLTLGGVIANNTSTGLIKAGTGALSLTNTGSTFSGGLTINAGTVIQGGNATGAQGTGTITLGDGATSASATLSGAGTAAITNTNAITIASGGTGTYTIADTSAQDYNFSGAVALNNAATFKVTGAGQLQFTNSITGSSQITIDGAGTGTKFVKLSGDNSSTFTGNVLIQNGNAGASGLKLGSSNALSNANTVTIDANSSIDLGGFNLSVAGLSDVVTGAGGSFITGTGNITVGGSGTYSFSGVINNTGTKNLTKSGAGTQTLAGANNYTGPTNVTGGTLEVSGSLTGTTSVSLTGGTLLLSGGSEKVNDAATVALNNGATIAFANGGTGGFSETLSTLTLSGTSTLDFGSGTTNGNTLIFAGLDAATKTGLENHTITLNVWNWSGTPGPDNGSIPDGQDRLLFMAAQNLDATQLAQISFFSGAGSGLIGTGNEITFGSNFEIVPVPEPSSTALLGSIAMLGLIGYRERRRLAWR